MEIIIELLVGAVAEIVGTLLDLLIKVVVRRPVPLIAKMRKKGKENGGLTSNIP